MREKEVIREHSSVMASSGGPLICYGELCVTEKTEGMDVYKVSLLNDREFSSQPSSAMSKSFFSLRASSRDDLVNHQNETLCPRSLVVCRVVHRFLGRMV